uniref:hypothetical protein n=1 Tax=Sulfurimonas sp. TaxID=2022749 RepID=UPI0025E99EBE
MSIEGTLIYDQFLDDIRESVNKEFSYYNVSIKENENISFTLLYYVNWRRRFICQANRTVIYSTEIKKNNKYLKYKKTIDKIEYKLKNAEEITSYLSKGIIETPYICNSKSQANDKDTFLNAFNIHHLHLGDKYLEKDKIFDINFIARTKELLFILIKNDKVYFLDILEHDFYNENLFRIIKNNWSQILEPYKLNGISPIKNEINKKDKKRLLNSGLNMMIELDEEIYAICEIVSSGHNFADVRNIDWLLEEIKTLSEILVENQENIRNCINKMSNEELSNFTYKIIIEKGLLYFFENKSKTILR